jgi:hypothetical protein
VDDVVFVVNRLFRASGDLEGLSSVADGGPSSRTTSGLGFVPAPTDPYHLFVLIKDLRAVLK